MNCPTLNYAAKDRLANSINSLRLVQLVTPTVTGQK